MTRKYLFCVLSSVLFFSGAALAEGLGDVFVAPKEWRAIPAPDSRLISFQTSANKEDSLMVLVRPISANGQNAQEWARDEVAAINKQGFKLIEEPAEKVMGTNTFVRLISWNDLAGFGLRNEQYFISYPQENGLLEVAILGPEALWEGQRGNIEAFLNSFRIS